MSQSVLLRLQLVQPWLLQNGQPPCLFRRRWSSLSRLSFDNVLGLAASRRFNPVRRGRIVPVLVFQPLVVSQINRPHSVRRLSLLPERVQKAEERLHGVLLRSALEQLLPWCIGVRENQAQG